MSVLTSIVARTPVTRIEDVLARMQEIEAALPPGDGIACFNKLYLAVTANVLEAARGGKFENPTFLRELDVAFGNLYFAALQSFDSGGSGTPRAWMPLFSGRARTDVAPLQFALAGMNAHINRDLPIGLVSTLSRLGIEMSAGSAEHRDYLKVNDLLAVTERSIKEMYFTPLIAHLDRHLAGVDDVAAMWSVRSARDTAWINGTALWHLRETAMLESDYLAMLDSLVGFAGRGLLVPTAV